MKPRPAADGPHFQHGRPHATHEMKVHRQHAQARGTTGRTHGLRIDGSLRLKMRCNRALARDAVAGRAHAPRIRAATGRAGGPRAGSRRAAARAGLARARPSGSIPTWPRLNSCSRAPTIAKPWNARRPKWPTTVVARESDVAVMRRARRGGVGLSRAPEC